MAVIVIVIVVVIVAVVRMVMRMVVGMGVRVMVGRRDETCRATVAGPTQAA